MPILLLSCIVFLPACAPGGQARLDDLGDLSGADTQVDSASPTEAGSMDVELERIGDAWQQPGYDIYELPADMPTLSIEIEAEAMARLDADPFSAPDERGYFVDDEGKRHEVDLNYRGAYQFLNVMTYYDLRNWKVKFDEGDLYRDRREWNFNYEPYFTQKLAYDLFRFAGVGVPGPQHVVLMLNGEYQGMYLQYEDPDNKNWLRDQFGDDDGDLYKGAYDIPGETQCFADLTWLGPEDSDYYCHYNKKTNLDEASGDYSVLRDFIQELNDISDDDFPAWLEANVDVERLRSYLVVSNFISNWDSYPQRPKNYWLYQDLRAQRMVYIPWDLDNTFDPWVDGTYNQMGTTVSVLYDLLKNEYIAPNDGEGTERPLVRRMMSMDGQTEAYLERYRELSVSILSEDYLLERLDALSTIVEPEISGTDMARLSSNNDTLTTFVQQRTAAVEAELATLP